MATGRGFARSLAVKELDPTLLLLPKVDFILRKAAAFFARKDGIGERLQAHRSKEKANYPI